MSRINLLPDNVAHKIAAGEVVERPASVVKELVENSLDASAAKIDIEVKDGGKEYIRVSDDGVGIHPEDLPLAFVRHATSKLQQADDLFAIETLGFRGEALSSIASVSHLTLQTRLHDESRGAKVTVLETGEAQVEPVGMSPGTTVEVRHLFYNTPARYKFLKATATERRYIVDLITNLSMAHHHVSFKLTADGKVLLQTNGTPDLLPVLTALYDHRTAKTLLPMNTKTPWGGISGYLGPPEAARGNRQGQTFIVNGRVINSPLISSALEKSYQGMLGQRRYPLAVVILTMDPTRVDVNVHPTKSEVRFQDEQELYREVASACKQALSASDLSVALEDKRPQQSDDSKPSQEHLILSDEEVGWQPKTWKHVDALLAAESASCSEDPPEPVLEPTPRPPTPTPQRAQTPPPSAPSSAPSRTQEGTQSSTQPSTPSPAQSSTSSSGKARDELVNARIIGQLQRSYILLETTTGLWILDQHIVHERILYEQFCEQDGAAMETQQILPQNLRFSPQDSAQIEQHLENLCSLGIDIEPFGPNEFLLRGLPKPLVGSSGAWEHEIVSIVADLQRHANWREQAALTMACRGSIKAGQRLDERQIHALLVSLAKTDNPFTCPHGRPIIVRLEETELLRRFGR